MKIIILIYIICIALSSSGIAQDGSIIINLKNNKTENIGISQIKKIVFENITGVEEYGNILSPIPRGEIKGLDVKGNNPNPFNEQTNIDFEIALGGTVTIIIYNNNGEQIQTLVCPDCQPGRNSLTWNCLDMYNNRVQSGIYYYEVSFGNEIISKKMILVK